MSVKREKSDAFMLRFPDRMRDRLKALAKENSRSLNAEIIHRLDESIHQGILFEYNSSQIIRDFSDDEVRAREDELVLDLLFYEEQMHKIALALRRIRDLKREVD